MSMNRLAAIAGCFACTFVAHADLIDFETLPDGSTPTDGADLTNAYNVGQFDFVRFDIIDSSGTGMPMFEATGEDGSDGFVSGARDSFDEEASGNPSLPLGNFFLRDNREVFATGQPLSLLITYTRALDMVNPVAPTLASGQIWDIDGVDNPEGRFFGTEQWEVYVTDTLGNRELAATSPEGNAPDGPLESLPWDFFVQDADGIYQIELVFVGTKTAGIGVAFDNFFTDGFIPTPGTAAIAGFAGLAATRRRR